MSDEPTRIIRRIRPDPAAGHSESTRNLDSPAPSSPDDRTRVYRHHVAGEAIEDPARSREDASPVVGWLVVLRGPGRGASLPLGYGMNSIGRGPENRVIVNFGDSEISRKAHATLTYDPRGRRFYIHPGPDATNLTYLGEIDPLMPVLAAHELKSGEKITMGQTTLWFVPLCGPEFEWS